MPGDVLRLTCKVNEVTSQIRWKKNGASEIPRAQISPRVGDESTLQIANVVPGDSGDYSCEAHNRAGTMSSTVKITVRGKIEVTFDLNVVKQMCMLIESKRNQRHYFL